jgi:inner membrane protein
MDNVTHSLVGLALAEVVVAARGSDERGAFRGAAYLVSLLANNFPDFDFCYAGITGHKLGYLLQHRGFTHQIVAALPFALLGIGAGALWLGRKHARASAADWRWLAALALAGPLLHVGMDYCNSYGVHPFWPLSNRWVYGDCLFIVEPLFWASLIPALLFAARTRVARILLTLLLAAMVVLCWVAHVVPWGSALAVTLLAAVMIAVAERARPRARIGAALGAASAVAIVFAGASHAARARARAAVAAAFPRARVSDLVLSPTPADPLCWTLIAVETEHGEYALRRASLSIAPAWIQPSHCPRWSRQTTAPLQRVSAADRPNLTWQGAFRAPLSELGVLDRESCYAKAFLRYARAPFWVERGGVTVMGDLRYDRGPRAGFAALELPRSGARCPRAVPPWRPPRARLISAGAGRALGKSSMYRN